MNFVIDRLEGEGRLLTGEVIRQVHCKREQRMEERRGVRRKEDVGEMLSWIDYKHISLRDFT